LVGASLVGNPVGVLLLTTVDADPLRVATFVTLAVLTIALLSGRSIDLPSTLPVLFGVGVVAGSSPHN
jgi:uncharacterized membrane protein YfcA